MNGKRKNPIKRAAVALAKKAGITQSPVKGLKEAVAAYKAGRSKKK